ncbi:hypothetical protein LPJ73_008863, partial [Coemansia sp. RSA 2703]
GRRRADALADAAHGRRRRPAASGRRRTRGRRQPPHRTMGPVVAAARPGMGRAYESRALARVGRRPLGAGVGGAGRPHGARMGRAAERRRLCAGRAGARPRRALHRRVAGRLRAGRGHRRGAVHVAPGGRPASLAGRRTCPGRRARRQPARGGDARVHEAPGPAARALFACGCRRGPCPGGARVHAAPAFRDPGAGRRAWAFCARPCCRTPGRRARAGGTPPGQRRGRPGAVRRGRRLADDACRRRRARRADRRRRRRGRPGRADAGRPRAPAFRRPLQRHARHARQRLCLCRRSHRSHVSRLAGPRARAGAAHLRRRHARLCAGQRRAHQHSARHRPGPARRLRAAPGAAAV